MFVLKRIIIFFESFNLNIFLENIKISFHSPTTLSDNSFLKKNISFTYFSPLHSSSLFPSSSIVLGAPSTTVSFSLLSHFPSPSFLYSFFTPSSFLFLSPLLSSIFDGINDKFDIESNKFGFYIN